MDTSGHVEYMSKILIDSAAFQLFASPSGEILRAPHKKLCLKTCACAPFQLFNYVLSGAEARCPTTSSSGTEASGGPLRDANLQNTAQVCSALENLSRFGSGVKEASESNLKLFSAICGNGTGDDFALDPMIRLLRGMHDCSFLKDDMQRCRPLVIRNEPIAFRHKRWRQRNLYYRFEVLPVGAKSCCCL